MSQPSFQKGLPVAPGEALPIGEKNVPPAPMGVGDNAVTPSVATPTVAIPAVAMPRAEAPSVAAIAASAALALYWCWAVDPLGLSGLLILVGGIGFTLGILGFFAVALALRGKSPQLTRTTAVALVITALMACVPAVTQTMPVRLLNAFILALACFASYRLLCGADEEMVLSPTGMLGSVGFFVLSQFAHFSLPFKLRPASGTLKSQRGPVAAGVLIAALILTVVLPLLGEADPVFASLAGSLSRILASDQIVLWGLRAVRYVLLALITCSLLHSMLLNDAWRAHSAAAGAGATGGRTPYTMRGATVATVLVALDVVYLVFVAVQVRNLFAGAPALAAAGGYAAYARTGFFQLVAVTSINLAVLAACLWGRRAAARNGLILVCELALLALTAVLLFSAAWRMTLYVREYGLTQLRAFTYLGMVAIAVLIGLFAARVLRPEFPLFKLAIASLSALWVAFSLSCPDAWIARFNVDGYLDGGIATIDIDYLSGLSVETDGAILSLSERIPSTDPHADSAHENAMYIRYYHDAQTDLGDGGWQVMTVSELLR